LCRTAPSEVSPAKPTSWDSGAEPTRYPWRAAAASRTPIGHPPAAIVIARKKTARGRPAAKGSVASAAARLIAVIKATAKAPGPDRASQSVRARTQVSLARSAPRASEPGRRYRTCRAKCLIGNRQCRFWEVLGNQGGDA
jgi:hypothetical protein